MQYTSSIHYSRSITMKHVGIKVAVLLLIACCALPATATAGDTLNVYASTNNLELIIGSDTTGAGIQAHKVYQLVSRDSTYVFQGAISVKSDIEVLGVLDPVTGRPPCIQPMALPDGSLPDFLFVLNGTNTKAVFKNLYFTGRSTDNTICATNYNGAGALIQVAGSGNRLTADHNVFCDWPTNCIGYSGDHSSLFVTNCKFRNCTISPAWYSGEAVRNTFNVAITDSLVMRNNTMFCMAYSAACPVTVNPCTYFEFSHNSVMYTFKNPFWIYNVTNAKFNDNLFYAAFSGASTLTEHLGMWDQLRSFDVTGIADFDTLNMPIAAWFDPADTAGSSSLRVLWPAEAKRSIEVKNNVCYWPKVITDFWKAWDDTAHIDSIVTPVWMNDRTTGMFSDKVHWPGLVNTGNLQVDPGFGSSIDHVVEPNSTSGAGFFHYFWTVRSNSPVVESYGYKVATVTPGYWIPEWPLPELADMQYSNTALKTGGTDGKPIGDPGWFNPGGFTGVAEHSSLLPEEFSLSQAYPNPFNPSTNVQFSLGKSGVVSLKVYNVLGQMIKVVVDNLSMTRGTYTYRIDMAGMASGVYCYQLRQGSEQITKTMVLVR
jgi:hypothetical protein